MNSVQEMGFFWSFKRKKGECRSSLDGRQLWNIIHDGHDIDSWKGIHQKLSELRLIQAIMMDWRIVRALRAAGNRSGGRRGSEAFHLLHVPCIKHAALRRRVVLVVPVIVARDNTVPVRRRHHSRVSISTRKDLRCWKSMFRAKTQSVCVSAGT